MITFQGRKMNFHVYYPFLILLMMVNILPAIGQRVIVQTKVDKPDIAIGEFVKLSVSVFIPQGAKLSYPNLNPNQLQNFEIIEKGDIDTTLNSNGSITINQDILLTSYDTGIQVIPALRMPYQVDNSYDTATTDHITLRVKGVQIDYSQDIKDIKPPVAVPFSWREFLPYLFYIISLMVLLGAGIYAWFYFRSNNTAQENVVIKPVEPAHITALRQLDILKQEKLIEKNQIKEFHSRLSDHIRRYIQGRFHIQAMERTSQEILSYFKEEKVDRKSLDALTHILILADQVKYAKAKPTEQENERNLNNAYYFVNNTKEFEKAPQEQ